MRKDAPPFASATEAVAWLNGKSVASPIGSCADRFARAVFQKEHVTPGSLYVHGELLDHCGSLMLGVCEESQGRGIGSTLMAILLASAKLRAHLRKVQLTVFTGNTPAIRLYRSFGCEFDGLHRCFSRRGDGYVDAYSMAVIFGDELRPAGAAPQGADVIPNQRETQAAQQVTYTHRNSAFGPVERCL